MLMLVLCAGLLLGGALGFLAGARPGLPAGPARFRPAGAWRPRGAKTAGPLMAAPAVRTRESLDFLYPLAAAFFAGFVFTTLVPDALTHSRGTLAAFAAGAAGMALLSRYVLRRDPCCEVGHDHKGLGAVSLAAMAVCSINDGLLLGLAQPAWHSGLNLGMFLHKVTSSFAIAQVLIRGGYRGAGLLAFGAVYALVSPAAMLGAGAAARILPGMEAALAFSAGVLAYVAVASLVPHAGGILRRRPGARLGFAAALLLSLGLGLWHRGLHSRGEAHPHAHPLADDGHPHSGAAPHADEVPHGTVPAHAPDAGGAH